VAAVVTLAVVLLAMGLATVAFLVVVVMGLVALVVLTVVTTIGCVPVLPLEGLALATIAPVALGPTVIGDLLLLQHQQQQGELTGHEGAPAMTQTMSSLVA
jgi:hypothetical protein